MPALRSLARTLVLIGALNWGLIGFFNFDLVAALFGEGTGLSRLIYALVGVGAVAELIALLGERRVKAD